MGSNAGKVNLEPVYFDRFRYEADTTAYLEGEQARDNARKNGWMTTCEMTYAPVKSDYFITGDRGMAVGNAAPRPSLSGW
jgi:hypothetical protein